MALAVLMLTLVSIGAVAQVKVVFGEKGEEKFPGTGGTITVSQETKGDEVTVTLTVTPDKGYTITKGDIKVYATYPPSGTRTPEIANNLTLYYNGSEKEDVKDPSAKRDYTFTIGSNFGVWVKEANFSSDSKGPKRGGNPTEITSLSQITSANGDYIITQDISGGAAVVNEFSGTLEAAINPETHMPYRITGLSAPLFTTLTGTVKNLVLEDVNISENTGNTGAIAGTANSAARIYNVGILSGSVGGTGNTGGLVGFLDGTARVINCYSYANITGGTNKGGIVGNNNIASSQSNIATMVMNCMFYGTISSGGTISPIYGGKIIDNKNSGGLATYNYYLYRTDLVITDNKYNCALAVEEKFLNRFEIFRQLENSNKKLASIYATGSADDADQKMLKWVLETADRTIENQKPYPVLKAQGYYPSIVNPDIEHAPDSASVGRNHGGKLGKTLTVHIGGVGSNAPTGASIRVRGAIQLQRTDKDFDRFNFNYDKVQLPYYNEVGTGNYTENRVVTGWKITSITGGTPGTYEAGDKWGGYNFADRYCTNKDKFDESGRVFSQGAYFEVPYGVTGITIEPYWGVAAYVSDQYYDVVYKEQNNSNYGGENVTGLGTQATNGAEITINGSTQKVYTSIDNARKSMSIPTSTTSGKTVYDYAVVLVGNVHQAGPLSGEYTPYTITSVDLDKDNEPDYSFIFSHYDRQAVSPIRFDFLNVVGTAQAQKPNGTSRMLNVSIFKPKGWFEVTNTCSIYFVQFEGDNGNKTSAPIILLGGVFDQFTSTQNQKVTTSQQYIHLGSNCWFKAFGNGTHGDGWSFTSHVPVSVTGGDFDGFYLSGVYRPDAGIQQDNAECYISSGRFNEVAGAAQQMIDGDVHWQIYNADITNFYGGGINAAKPITGDITVDIFNSHVDTYCGGPKFGDMQKSGTTFTTKYSTNKAGSSTGTYSRAITKDGKVTTNATGCHFKKFFGAGYGGTSYSELKFADATSYNFITLANNYINDRGKYFTGTNTAYKSDYGNKGPGVATDFSYEFFVWSRGQVGARFYVKYASFSLAQCNDVESKLKNCIIEKDFFGGGSIGEVAGTATSELENCIVKGSVYGGGYSASLPSIPIRNEGFATIPVFNNQSGMFEPGVPSETIDFDWTSGTLTENTKAINESGDKHDIYTNLDLTILGQVKNSQVTIKGTTTVEGDVYGGGALASMDESGETMVSLIGGTINGNVYGGGQGRLPGTKDENGKDLPEVKALVGSANVELNKGVADGGCVVKGNIFGCNNLNGTPKGSAIVHIYKTNGDSRTASEDLENIDETKHHYHLNAVYGGGNLAAYEPTANDAKANVIIDGCNLTSIRTVYGGGNAASTPATSVVVNGTYEIEEVFGGGNGKDALPDGSDNPGANVGFKNYSAVEDTYSTKEQRQSDEFVNEYVYGSGEANVTIVGGRVHRVFGGSNTKGNVRITAVTMLDDIGGCDFKVEEAYGGGKSAPMDGEAKLLMSCIPGLKVAYGGAEDANILGDVTLNITNGNFDRVFGGNNISGTIGGKITVNVEETGCSPIIIGQLYGGGNQASYNAHGQTGPTLNIKSFTSIGEVYGGGYGVSATVTGDTHVNINEVKGRFTAGTHNYGTAENPIGVNSKTGPRTISFSEFVRNENGDFLDANGQVTTDESERAVVDQTIQVDIPEFTANKIGGIGMVYGGGNAAKVDGNTHVNIGTQSTIDFVTGVGEASPQTGVAVEGVSIIGNVYGGGNKAEVTGNTNVVIGRKETPPSPARASEPPSESQPVTP